VSAAFQVGASNDASPVRVHSDGGDGSVSQSNDASSHAGPGNLNLTGQAATQTASGRGCGCASSGIQALGQEAGNGQLAGAFSGAFQFGGVNDASPASVGSSGSGGSVSQSNGVDSHAFGLNANLLHQGGREIAM
jgi:hypothetical protein